MAKKHCAEIATVTGSKENVVSHLTCSPFSS